MKKFKEGDLAAVGCMVDSDRTCPNCKDDLEQFCEGGATFTYNSPDKNTRRPHFRRLLEGDRGRRGVRPASFRQTRSGGGGSAALRGDHDLFAFAQMGRGERPESWRGWSRRARPHGGEICARFGARVVLFTTSPGKTEDAKRLGADEVVVSKNAEEMQKHLNSFDFILDTVSAKHPLDDYLQLLKRDGTMCMVGASPEPLPVSVFGLIFGRRRLVGSLIGGIAETQEMLDFCAEHDITCEIEMIQMDQINEAYERMLKSDVKYRFVIDMASLN